MKIKDLIKKLKEFDPEHTVTCYSEDDGLKSNEGPVQLFEIDNVTEVEAESGRLNDGIGKPFLKFGKTTNSSKFVLIEITSDV